MEAVESVLFGTAVQGDGGCHIVPPCELLSASAPLHSAHCPTHPAVLWVH